ncbi:hypothetical protein WJX73_008285 [Symbiochloris irregularis]|uniref:20 kDa chaperonin, chloroplastic n=1 Tax=Symbiochloris irregularis TaxID=706552 RepID=A0AAW1P349_9CHLO
MSDSCSFELEVEDSEETRVQAAIFAVGPQHSLQDLRRPKVPCRARFDCCAGAVQGCGTLGRTHLRQVKEGETVVYSKYAGTEVSLKGAEHVILKEDDVIGLLPGKDISELKPLGDRILIQVEKARDRSEGGVLLSAEARDKPTFGKVLAVGSGKADDKGNVVKPNLSVGDLVLYQKFSGTEFQGDNDDEYIVVREMDVLASVT